MREQHDVYVFENTGAHKESLAGHELFRHAADSIDSAINPVTDVQATEAYRRQVAKILVRRALERATTRAQEGARA